MPDPDTDDTAVPEFHLNADDPNPWFRICKHCAAVVLAAEQDDGVSIRAHVEWHAEQSKKQERIVARLQRLETRAGIIFRPAEWDS
jgi:pentose-5-phosphate-3-epimerase